MFIIDAHTHLGNHPTQTGTPEEMMQEFKECGLEGAVFCPMAGVMAQSGEDLRRGNLEALGLYDRYPDFLYPGAALHPGYPEQSRYALDAFIERKLVWVGELLADNSQIPFDDERWMGFFRSCCEHHLIVQLHLHDAPEVAVVAKTLPELTIIGSHLDPEVLPKLVDFPNVLIDISGYHGGLCRGTLPKARSMFGAERLLFGSDAPGYDPAPYMLRVKRDFPESEQQMVFGGNLLRILKKHGVSEAFGRQIV